MNVKMLCLLITQITYFTNQMKLYRNLEKIKRLFRKNIINSNFIKLYLNSLNQLILKI